MTYQAFICNQIQQYQTSDPIYAADIAERLCKEYGLEPKAAAAATAVAFNRLMEKHTIPNLRFYQKGIYYLAAETPFGEVGVNKEKIIAEKYLLPDQGYETDFSALYRLGLTTQIPAERCLATNKASDCQRRDKKLNVLIRPAKTHITEDNKAYLQLLDVLDIMDKAPVDIIEPFGVLAEYIKKAKLNYRILLSYADKYYNKKTILKLARIASQGG